MANFVLTGNIGLEHNNRNWSKRSVEVNAGKLFPALETLILEQQETKRLLSRGTPIGE